jgi:hypothetical protein
MRTPGWTWRGASTTSGSGDAGPQVQPSGVPAFEVTAFHEVGGDPSGVGLTSSASTERSPDGPLPVHQVAVRRLGRDRNTHP